MEYCWLQHYDSVWKELLPYKRSLIPVTLLQHLWQSSLFRLDHCHRKALTTGLSLPLPGSFAGWSAPHHLLQQRRQGLAVALPYWREPEGQRGNPWTGRWCMLLVSLTKHPSCYRTAVSGWGWSWPTTGNASQSGQKGLEGAGWQPATRHGINTKTAVIELQTVNRTQCVATYVHIRTSIVWYTMNHGYHE